MLSSGESRGPRPHGLAAGVERAEAIAFKVIEWLSAEIGLAVCRLPFASVVEQALDQVCPWDPFDRLIVAHARANNAALITKDERIRQHSRRSICK